MGLETPAYAGVTIWPSPEWRIIRNPGWHPHLHDRKTAQMDTPDRHFWRAFVPVWATLILVVLLWGGSIYRSYVYAGAAGRERAADATIIRYHPEDHARYDYVFAVNGTNHTGRDSYLNGNEGSRVVGRKVRVYYDPTAPDTNGLSDLRDKAVFVQPIAVLLLALLIGNWIAYLDWQRRRSKASYS